VIINKKWYANGGKYLVWLSPSNSGPDYDGTYYEGTDPVFSALTGTHFIAGRIEVAGEFIPDPIYPSSLWAYDIFASQVSPAVTVDGHTGLWALDVDSMEISPTQFVPKFEDLFWVYGDGEIQLRSEQNEISYGG